MLLNGLAKKETTSWGKSYLVTHFLLILTYTKTDPENEEEEVVNLIKFDGFCVRTYEEDQNFEEEEDVMAG